MSDNNPGKIEYSEDDKNKFAKLLRAGYNERSMTDYFELLEYLQSKTKHLAKSDRAIEKLKSQALTYMQSVMSSENRKNLPKDILLDVAKNGDKFIEKFGHDADGAINPVSRKFKEWLIMNKNRSQQTQKKQDVPVVKAPAEKVVANSKEDIKAGMKAGAAVLGVLGAAYGGLTAGPVGFVAGGIGGAMVGSTVVPIVAKIESAMGWLSNKIRKPKKNEKKLLDKTKEKTKEKENKNNFERVVANSKEDIKAGMKAGATVLGVLGAAYGGLTAGPVGFVAGGIGGAVVGGTVMPIVAKIESAMGWLSNKISKSKKTVHINSLKPQTLEQVKGRINDKIVSNNMEVIKSAEKTKKSNNLRKRAIYRKDDSRAM